MGQFEAHTNPEKNRLYIKFVGVFSAQEMASTTTELNTLLKDLKPGFTVVSDISEYKPSSQETAEQIKRGADNLVKKGMKKLIRVIGESAVAQMQFDRTAQAGGIQANTAASIQEAERLLDNEE